MREIILDTETTGLDINTDRLTEIGMIEIYDKMPTGNIFQSYFNPQVLISKEAQEISGLTNEFLLNKPLFKSVVDDILEFIDGDPIVAHNAEFDKKFLNKELELAHKPLLKNTIIDTYLLSKQRFNRSMSLNQLCKKYGIDLNQRKLHGALIDAELLSKVYYYLSIGQEEPLIFNSIQEETEFIMPYREFSITNEELENHYNFLKQWIK